MVELLYKRNLNSKTFDTGNTQVHPDTGENVPVYGTKIQEGLHYAKNGKYKDVDTNIITQAKYEFSHEVVKMRGVVRFGDTSATTKKHLFGVEDDNDNWLNVKLDLENYAVLTTAGNKAEFPGAGHCQVNHYVLYNGVKTEYLIFNKAANSLTVTFKHNDEITPEQRGNTIVFVRDDKDIFTVKSPFAYDADVGIDVTEPVVMTLGTTGEFDSATLVVDAAWLLASTNPIIDPDITIEDGVDGGVIEDAMIASSPPDYNYGGWTVATIGDDYGESSTLIGVDLSPYPNISVISCKFSIYTYAGTSLSDVWWYRILRLWGEGVTGGAASQAGECSYNDYANPAQWTTAGCNGVGTDREGTTQNASALSISSSGYVDFDCLPDSASADAGSIFSILIKDGGAGVRYFRTSDGVLDKPTFYMEYVENGNGAKLSGAFGLGRLGIR